jgi:hypothetical protein
MSNFTIRRAIAVAVPALAGVALTLAPAASQANEGSGPPIVATGPAHEVGAAVQLTGTVKTHDLPTTYEFQYGPGSATGGAPTVYASHTTPATLPAGTATEKVSATVTGVLAGYHYRLVAFNSDDAETPRTGKDRVYTPVTKHKKPTKPKKSELELPSLFEPTPVGGAFVLSGTLTGTGNAAREVVLQSSPYPYTAAFTDVGAPTLTSATGAFSFRVAHLTESTRVRVATVSAPLLVSDTLTQLALERVTLNVRRSKRVEGLVRLYGTATPAATGANVFIQLEQQPKARPPKAEKPEKTPRSSEQERPPKFHTKFATILKRDGRSLSRFSVIVDVRTSGNYRAFVELPAGPLAPAGSETVQLHAAPRHKKTTKS